MQKCKEFIHVHQQCGKHHILANSVMAPYFFIYANRNKAEPREVTKQVVWIILHNRIFHRTIRHIRSGFPSYARTLCALTLPAYALKYKSNITLSCSTSVSSVNFLSSIDLHFQKNTNVVYRIYINYVNASLQILYKGVTKVYIEKTEKTYILVYQPYHNV